MSKNVNKEEARKNALELIKNLTQMGYELRISYEMYAACMDDAEEYLRVDLAGALNESEVEAVLAEAGWTRQDWNHAKDAIASIHYAIPLLKTSP